MTTSATAAAHGRVSPSIDSPRKPTSSEAIEEDSPFWIAMSAFPILGLGIGAIQQQVLNERISRAEPSRAAELIQVKNKYKIGFIAHNLIWIAGIIARCALGVFSLPWAVAFTFVWAMLIKTTVREIKLNKESIDLLLRTGELPKGRIIC